MSRFLTQLTLGNILPEETRNRMMKIAVGNASRLSRKAKLAARAMSAKRDAKGRFVRV